MVILLLMALGSGLTLKKLTEEEEVAARKARHVPDFYMENFATTTMDATGQRKRVLMAEYMGHYPDTDTSEFEKPYLILHHPGRPAWHVRSESSAPST